MFLKILILLSGASVLHCTPVPQTKITNAADNELGSAKNTGAVYFKNGAAARKTTDSSHYRKLTLAILSDILRAAHSEAAAEAGDMKAFQNNLHEFLSRYYDVFVDPPVPEDDVVGRDETLNIYEQMQSDQPSNDGFKSISVPIYNTKANATDIARIREDRNRGPSTEAEGRSKDNWVEKLKHNILTQIGRTNVTVPKTYINSLNISNFMRNFTNGNLNGDDPIYTEKIRSYYPTCEIPKNTEELWKDENALNLYFNFEYDKNVTIATATLRLYRIPHENLTDSPNLGDGSCETVQGEDEKLLRISTYWYTKSLKRHRVKKRLCDSKVVGENARWVELSVKPATKAWVKGTKNLGLAILVENQDEVALKASQYFKGASCTVGASTPKPIPTIIVDAARQYNQLEGINNFFGRNSATALDPDTSLLPTVDIRTLQYPDDYTASAQEDRRVPCSPYNDDDRQISNLLRLNLNEHHHIRHQKKFETGEQALDPRSRIIEKKIVVNRDQLGRYDNINR